jgi:hypothetical protein
MTPQVTIVETETLQALIGSVEGLELMVISTISELKEANSKPYLTTQEVLDMLNKKEDWLIKNKAAIGYSKSTGNLLFKRSDVIEFIESGYHKKRKS